MNDELTLDFLKPITKAEKFAQFHTDNPHVLAELETLTRELISHGTEKFGIALIYEQLRWRYLVTQDRHSARKLNNDYRSHYARLIIERHPEWTDLFEIRHLRSA